MEGRRRASNLEEGLRNTEIKRETDVRNSLGPQESSERGSSSSSERGSGSSSERSRSSSRSSSRDSSRSSGRGSSSESSSSSGSDRSRSSGVGSSSIMEREGDAYGRETPGRSEDRE